MTEAGGEVLVYDEQSHHIHRLNQVSAAVWRHCDGRRTVADLATETGMAAEMVQVALGKLADARLLDGDLPAGVRAAGQSRRSFLKKAAVAGGVALPVLVSISAPTAAQTTSQPPTPTPCGGVNQPCCPVAGSLVGSCNSFGLSCQFGFCRNFT